MKKITFLIVVLFSGIFAFAQVAPDKYFIQFTDKNDSPYSINNPGEYLTQRALDRRAKYGIEITAQDLPVNPQYIAGVEALGADLLFPTKWMNGVTVYTTDPTVIENINALPYVDGVSLMVSRYDPVKKALFMNDFSDDKYKSENLKSGNSVSSMNYGFGTNQIEQLNGILLHDDGYKGEGMVIAVLDGGFYAVDSQPLFDSLWANDQILGTKDFVHPGGSVFTESGHGRMVLSCMGANIEGQLVGTAPKASYWLLRSEYVVTENVLEEYNWVSAAEFADSVGADVINSSLGYIDFDMPVWDHDYEDMNGSTAVVTIGADIAESKGILVVNSAGNSGGNPFPWIGAPADGFDVFSIGAVTSDGDRAGFSSIGPTADGRTKPDIMAQGQGSAVADEGSGVTFGSGTSFSSPIMAGISTCLMQAFPNRTPAEIRAAIKQSGNNSSSPDNYMGWGIPDFMEAYSVMTTIEIEEENGEIINAYPNPFTDNLTVELNINGATEAKLTLMDINGRLVFSDSFSLNGSSTQFEIGNKISQLPAGVYFLGVNSIEKFEVKRIVKNF